MPNIDLDDFDPRDAIDDLMHRNDDRARLGRLIPLLALLVLAAAAVVTYRVATILLEGRRGERDVQLKLAAVAANEARSGATTAAAIEGGDDLKIIEGIGPRYESVLKAAGIQTFRDLADLRAGRIETILREAGGRMADPSTWPAQARLAADGDVAGAQRDAVDAEGRPRGEVRSGAVGAAAAERPARK